MPIQKLILFLCFFFLFFCPALAQQPIATTAEELDGEEIDIEEIMAEEISSAPDANDTNADLHATGAEKKYNRRVMLMVFINESRNKNLEYLGISVADAFSVPLVKTGNFVILNRDSVHRYMTTMGIPHDDIYKAENATRLGKAIGADVVVVGKFVNVGDSVIIEAKAVDVQAGLVSVEDSEQITTNASMFSAINQLAERMSGPMAEKMKPLEVPPPPAEVTLDEKQISEEVKRIEEKKANDIPLQPEKIAAEQRLYLEPGISLLYAPGISGRQLNYDGRYAFGALNPGLAGMLVFQSSMPQWKFLNLLRWFDYMVFLEYARYSAAYEVLSSTGQTLLESETMQLQTFGTAFSLAHAFPVWKFTLTPYAGLSVDYASFTASDSTALFKGIIPGANMGCRWRIYEWRSFELGINWRMGFKYLNDGNSFFHQGISISGGYRI